MLICSVKQYRLSTYICKFIASFMTGVSILIHICKWNESENLQFLRHLRGLFSCVWDLLKLRKLPKRQLGMRIVVCAVVLCYCVIVLYYALTTQ